VVGWIHATTPLTEVSSDELAWSTHSGTYDVPAGVQLVRFSVSPSAASNGDIDSSNLLDDVKLCGEVVPVPEPAGAAAPIACVVWLIALAWHRRVRRIQANASVWWKAKPGRYPDCRIAR